MPAELTSRSRWVIRYSVAVAAGCMGLLVRWALEAWVGPGLPTYITFYPAVMVVGLLGGLGPGLVATAGAALAADYWVVLPHGFGIEKPVDAVGLVFFSGMGLFMSLVAEYLRRAQRKAGAYDREQALRESERFIKSVAEASPHWFYVFDFESQGLSYANRPILRDLGYPPDVHTTVTGLDAFRAYMPPEEIPHLARLVEEWQTLPEGVVRDDEYRLRHADGTLHYFAGREIVFARRSDGTVQRILGLLLDITDRKAAEEALHASEEQLRQRVAELQTANAKVQASRRAALNLMEDAVQARKQAEQSGAELRSAAEQRRLALEAADLGAWDYQFQTGEVYWDERCREMWGIPQADTIDYAGAIAAIHPEDRAGVDEAVKQALADRDGGAYHREFRVVWPDGTAHWIASHGRVYFDGEGDRRRAVRFIGSNREITVEKEAAEAVRQSEERYRGLVELSPEAVFVNRENRIVLVNPAALQLFGASSAEQLLGKSPFEVFHPDFHAVMHERIGKLFAGQRVALIEEKIVRLDGVVVDVEVVAASVMDQGERAILVLLRDVTERKRAQATLQQTAAELERSNRDLEQFAYVASHDLQEPLRAVGGYVKLLEHRFPDKLDAKARDYIAGAADGAARMECLITDLLAFSRVGTRGGTFVPVDLDTVLNQVLSNFQVGIESFRATITRDPLPTLPVDATQMMQLFQNLIGNALKFHGESPPSIHVGARRQGGRWLFSVHDNGIGIEPQYFGKIFQVFQRLHTREDYPGTGIGLAICKKIVERHGGTIWVESQPGQGATFNFTIPEAASG